MNGMEITNTEAVYEVTVKCEDKNRADEIMKELGDDCEIRQEENINIIFTIRGDDADTSTVAEFIVEELLKEAFPED